MTVFAPKGLSKSLTHKLDDFLDKEDFPSLYKSYNWENDTHSAGFPDIHRLELQLSLHAEAKGVTHGDIVDVAQWGKLPKAKQIAINNKHAFGVLNKNLRSNCDILLSIEKNLKILPNSCKIAPKA